MLPGGRCHAEDYPPLGNKKKHILPGEWEHLIDLEVLFKGEMLVFRRVIED